MSVLVASNRYIGSGGGDFAYFVAANPQGIDATITPAGIEVLNRIAALASEYGSGIIFVFAPEYSGNHPMIRNRADLFAGFQYIASTWQVPLWDYSDWEHAGSNLYFYNSQHLNAEGARLFSITLSEDLAIWLEGSGLDDLERQKR